MKIADPGPNLASLQELVDSVPALIHTARPDGSIDFFNQRWLEFVGLRLEDLEGWKWTAAVHADDVRAGREVAGVHRERGAVRVRIACQASGRIPQDVAPEAAAEKCERRDRQSVRARRRRSNLPG
jgi:PAS domain-containing protein